MILGIQKGVKSKYINASESNEEKKQWHCISYPYVHYGWARLAIEGRFKYISMMNFLAHTEELLIL